MFVTGALLLIAFITTALFVKESFTRQVKKALSVKEMRRIVMMPLSKKICIMMTVAAMALTLVVGCSNLSNPVNQTGNSQSPTGTTANRKLNTGTGTASNITKTLLINMRKLAEQGKVINSDFSVKTTVYQDVEKAWGQADTTTYVAAAKGRYAAYLSHNVVFGINKGDQLFEVRSFDRRLGSVTLANAKEVFGTPAYDSTYNGQEIIGYPAGPEFKIEMVFPQPTNSNPNPPMDHYNVLYPKGTINMMADDPGRQW